MINLFRICCGQLDEQKNTGVFQDETSYKSWLRPKGRIQTREDQISLMNRIQVTNSLEEDLAHTTRDKIVSKSISDGHLETYASPVFDKSEEDIQFILFALRQNFLFEEFSDEVLRKIAMAMEEETCKAGTAIIRQGEEGDFFYVLRSGEVIFEADDECVGLCKAGQSFGELALLYDAPRAASCIVKSYTAKIYKVDQLTFRYTVAGVIQHHKEDAREQLRNWESLKCLSDKLIDKLVNAMTIVSFKQGEKIIAKGEIGNVCYIILEGEAHITNIGLGDSTIEDQTLGPSRFIGEQCLLTGEPRNADVFAGTDISAFAFDRETMDMHLGPLYYLMDYDMMYKTLRGLPSFHNSGVTELEYVELIQLMGQTDYVKGDVVTEAGKPYEFALWIIRSGTIFVYNTENEDETYTLKAGDYFADGIVSGNEQSTLSAVCEEDLTVWVLRKEEIESVIGDMERLGKGLVLAKSQRENMIPFDDLKKVKPIGQGAFGVVWQVGHPSSKYGFALKEISKRKLLDMRQVKSVLREKSLLDDLRHPFILELVGSYQDATNLYLLTAVLPGGDLYTQLNTKKGWNRGLPNDDVAFYAACIIEALAHFHHRKIAYRDLKLENVLIDADGYAVICDLGFAKLVPNQTFTMVGTPDYIAPEIIASKGYDKSCDYWSYGVLVYELLAGVTPFYKEGSTRMEMFKRIIRVEYEFKDCFFEEAKKIIGKLLQRQPCERLGNMKNGCLGIKKDFWFARSAVEFHDVNNKTAKAPWKPRPCDYDPEEVDIDMEQRDRPLTEDEHNSFVGF